MSTSLYARLARRFGRAPTPLDRRTFLRRSAAAGAAALLSGHLASCASTRRPILISDRAEPARHPRRIAIVGGGFAGLACAYELHAVGHHITVFEARSRVGGRVLTLDEVVPGARVEGGAELIGSNHPTWAAYARRFGLVFQDITEDDDLDTPIVIRGQVLREDQAASMFEQMDFMANQLTRLARRIDADEPWTSRNAAELDARSLGLWLEEHAEPGLARDAMLAMLEGDNGAPAHQQSLLGVLAAIAGGGHERYWTESEVYRCAHGNDLLARRLTEPIADRIKLGAAVSSIQRTPQGQMQVSVSGQVSELFDEVVLAVPPSVWDYLHIDPALPADLVPQMGLATKHLFRVRDAFWRDEGLAAWSLSDGLYSWSWDGSDGRLPADAPAISPRCFTLFAGGSAAQRARALPPDSRADATIDDVARVYRGFRDAYQDRNWFMDWPSDPLCRAGYSCAAPGQITTIAPRLRQGLPGLHLAGEHCSTAFPGYMEGALESGVRAARAIHHVAEAHA